MLTKPCLPCLPLLTSMQNFGQFVKKAEYARMHGWDRSYISKLQRENRVVLSDDGKLVDWAATDILIGKTADPSKIGVKLRHAEERAQSDVFESLPGANSSAIPNASTVSVVPEDSPFHKARASREHYNGQMARLEYEWVTGLLLSRPRVEDASHTIGRSFRDRVLGMAPRVAPELAAITDPWELEKKLSAALRQVLDEVSAYGVTLMRDVINDPGRGKLTELARLGRERYGTDRDDTPAS